MINDDWNLEDEEILKPIPKNNYECKGCDNKITFEEDVKNHGYCSKCISDTNNYLNQDYTIQLINGQIWLNNHINRTKIILTEKEINHINNLMSVYKNKK